MEINYRKKAKIISISISILIILIVSSIGSNITGNIANSQLDDINYLEFEGWEWKSSFSNYAPKGMPDFDKHQNSWQSILSGENQVIDSSPTGDDFFNPSENCIVPGPNCHLETNPVGDDYISWCFSGPVSVANCFWYIDSQNADHQGDPGDGEDIFPLVEDYVVGDDHLADNVPILIEKLAVAMDTCDVGKTKIDDMEEGINNWFDDSNLTHVLKVNTYDKPDLDLIVDKFVNNDDIILLLGNYNRILISDQEQTDWDMWSDLNYFMPGNIQSFTPSVTSLNSIELLLTGSEEEWTTVELSIYDSFPENLSVEPIAVTTRVLNLTLSPEWITFEFYNPIDLTIEQEYFITVRSYDDEPYDLHWCYSTEDTYSGGSLWWCDIYDYILTPEPDYDFAFKTKYYANDCFRFNEQYVTVAGLNTDESLIALSDPSFNLQNGTTNSSDFNDPYYLSHDIFHIQNGSPPGTDYSCYLSNFTVINDYTVIEQAVVISSYEEEPPYVKITKPSNGIYISNRFIIGFFIPFIMGKITIEVEAIDNLSGIDKIEYYIEDNLQKTVTEEPYEWNWRGGFGIKNIEVIAFDNSGNHATDKISVLKFF